MTNQQRRLNPDQAAAETQMEARVVWRYADLGLITPSAAGYGDADLAELRRVRRLHEDLELDHQAIEIILRMRRQIESLQADIRRLERAVRAARRPLRPPNWFEVEWEDL
jgi:DNA-binding transcriptional MerR regulator